jgi:hypothetical protein
MISRKELETVHDLCCTSGITDFKVDGQYVTFGVADGWEETFEWCDGALFHLDGDGNSNPVEWRVALDILKSLKAELEEALK